jgi:hypothetical protein
MSANRNTLVVITNPLVFLLALFFVSLNQGGKFMLKKQEKTVSQLLNIYATDFTPLDPTKLYSRYIGDNWGQTAHQFSQSDIAFDWQTHQEIEQLNIEPEHRIGLLKNSLLFSTIISYNGQLFESMGHFEKISCMQRTIENLKKLAMPPIGYKILENHIQIAWLFSYNLHCLNHEDFIGF